MNLKGWLFGDFIDKIEYNLDKKEIVWKFPLNEHEISYNSVIFVDKYQIAVISIGNGIIDTFTHGKHKLNIDTLPNISKELNWKDDHDEPFVADIYFLDTNSFEFEWQTKEPILLHDRDDTIAQLITSGTFKTKISTISLFLSYMFKDGEIKSINSLFEDNIIDALTKRSSPIYRLASSKLEFSYFLKSRLVNIFTENGLILEEVDVAELDVEQKLPSMANLAAKNNHYYIIKDSKPRGPYTKDKIEQMITNSELIPTSYIWKEGLDDWVKVKELFDVE